MAEIDHRLRDSSKVALTEMYGDADTRQYRISFNPLYNLDGNEEKMNLLHEMCHIRLDVEKEKEFDMHGFLWQSCMHDVANKRGFDLIW